MEASRKKLMRSIIVAAIIAAVLSVPHMAILLPLFALLLILRLGKLLYAFVTGGEVNVERRQSVIVLAAMILVVVGVHTIRHLVARNHANEMISAIERYISVNHRCPSKLDDVGYSHETLRDRLGYSGYYCEAGVPRFSYAVTFSLFDMYQYDFNGKRWTYRHD